MVFQPIESKSSRQLILVIRDSLQFSVFVGLDCGPTFGAN